MRIYDDYNDEPEDVFLPLNETRYSYFYELEMGDFRKDLPFYQRHLPTTGDVLEIACGTGRISNTLAVPGRTVTGLDNSLSMLKKAHKKRNEWNRYVAMDMRFLAFSKFFDAIIIPYNSLNLLSDTQEVLNCLTGCHQLLRPDGILLLHLFVPNLQLLQQAGQRTFQFQIFDDPAIGRVIKEVRKTYHAKTEVLHLEECYRLRPNRGDRKNEDLSRHMNLCAWSAEKWFDLLNQSDFSINRLYGGYELTPFLLGQDSSLLLTASLK